MAFVADHAILIDRLDEELRSVPEPTPDLFSRIIAGACTRVSVLSRSGKATRIALLIEAAAWTEAALALIELEMPAWKLRRLVCEDHEWFCSLSRQPNLPDMLDDTADANHELMSVAILLAFLQARRLAETVPQAGSAVRAHHAAVVATLCCDNFA